MGSGRQLFYESLQYRHTQKPIALLCDSKRDQFSPMNTKIKIRFIQERACHHPICDFSQRTQQPSSALFPWIKITRTSSGNSELLLVSIASTFLVASISSQFL